MDFRDIMVGAFAPLLIFSLMAVYRYGSLLFKLTRTGEFELKRHGLWVVIVLVFITSVVENAYYGYARVMGTSRYVDLSITQFFPLFPKVLWTAAGCLAAVTYCAIVEDKNAIVRAIAIWLVVWASAAYASMVWL